MGGSPCDRTIRLTWRRRLTLLAVLAAGIAGAHAVQGDRPDHAGPPARGGHTLPKAAPSGDAGTTAAVRG